MMKRLAVRVRGIVQGVGFRPFVYRLAQENCLTGFVFNDDGGVLIEAQGEETNLAVFLEALRRNPPPAASVSEVNTAEKETDAAEAVFTINSSPPAVKRQALISPDLAVCPDCRREIMDKSNRRYHYPFINCTNCGPRFSIVEDIPYDRQKTTMKSFVMCDSCRKEYEDPLDRRFHAQPNACGRCGPHYELLDNEGNVLTKDNEEILEEAHRLIKRGKIIAVKGIGGYHLVCDARNETAVSTLRHRKKRCDKALAVMAGSVEAAERLCLIDEKEKRLLESPPAPIVLLNKRADCYDLAPSVAPGNGCLGVMLPYAPIHCLLLGANDVFVMTSANISEEPIVYLNDDACRQLNRIADYFLLHDRRINMRTDDSVVRVVRSGLCFIRRSRGFAPSPLCFPFNRKKIALLAAGSQLKNTFCLIQDNRAFLSQHIGDLANKAANDSYRDAVKHYMEIFDIVPQAAACDMHPDYFSSRYARSLNLPVVEVQHHYAHIASVLAEYNIKEKVIGIALDGTGYGDDGNLWGGEFLVCDCLAYERLAHFSYIPLPGASAAVREPWRIAAYLMRRLYGRQAAEKQCGLWRIVPDNWPLAVQAADKGLNSPLSSSAGRLFDAAAAVLGIRGKINYEGQAAIELEQAAGGCQGKVLPYDTELRNGKYEINFLPVFGALAENKMSTAENAASFHLTMAQAVAQMAGKIKKETGIRKIALSGGVFQNVMLLNMLLRLLDKDFSVYINRRVPVNDGGLSFGQAAVACARLDCR